MKEKKNLAHVIFEHSILNVKFKIKTKSCNKYWNLGLGYFYNSTGKQFCNCILCILLSGLNKWVCVSERQAGRQMERQREIIIILSVLWKVIWHYLVKLKICGRLKKHGHSILQLLPSRGKVYFPTPWIWDGFVTSFDQRNVTAMTMGASPCLLGFKTFCWFHLYSLWAAKWGSPS